jgi:hypothetical protein
MERLLARLERRFGRYAIPNLIGFIVGGMAIVWVLTLLKPGFEGMLALDLAAVLRGQVWRLVTFLFIPPPSTPFWILINLYFTWWVGSSLESQWGSFKFNVYYFLGALATIVAAVFVGGASNVWLDASLLLAFATVFPDVSILLFFVIPLRVKWLGVFTALVMVYFVAIGGWGTRAAIAAALVNYLVFFAGHWLDAGKSRSTIARQRSRLETFRAASTRAERGGPAGAAVFGQRVCAICGAKEADGADIRVCSCDKCGNEARTLCLEHARSH